MKILTRVLTSALLISASVVCAAPVNQFYGAIEGGIYQAQFNSSYIDQTDVIPQNISGSLIQNGYIGGLALGYTRLINPRYFVSVELTGNIEGDSALYQSGAANTAFSDKIQINDNVDLSLVPGIMTESAFSPYFRLGISYASVRDRLTSPVGYDPTNTQFNSNKNIFGLVAGLGVKYAINDRIGLFVEANYHDYGTINFSSFQNFSADYTHSAHLYSYAALIGATYAFNV